MILQQYNSSHVEVVDHASTRLPARPGPGHPSRLRPLLWPCRKSPPPPLRRPRYSHQQDTPLLVPPRQRIPHHRRNHRHQSPRLRSPKTGNGISHRDRQRSQSRPPPLPHPYLQRRQQIHRNRNRRSPLPHPARYLRNRTPPSATTRQPLPHLTASTHGPRPHHSPKNPPTANPKHSSATSTSGSAQSSLPPPHLSASTALKTTLTASRPKPGPRTPPNSPSTAYVSASTVKSPTSNFHPQTRSNPNTLSSNTPSPATPSTFHTQSSFTSPPTIIAASTQASLPTLTA